LTIGYALFETSLKYIQSNQSLGVQIGLN